MGKWTNQMFKPIKTRSNYVSPLVSHLKSQSFAKDFGKDGDEGGPFKAGKEATQF
jgi:hypothetical protein